MTSKEHSPLILLGAGGHAKVLAEILCASEREFLGFLDLSVEKGHSLFGVVCLGADEEIGKYSVDSVQLVNGVGFLPGEQSRRKLALKMRALGYSFARSIHSSAVIAGDTDLSEGVQVMAGAIIQPGSQIGQDTIVNTRASVDHDCKVGGCCHLAPGVTICGGVHLSDNVYVGAGASIMQNIQIGAGAVIAAGALINCNIPAGTQVVQKRQNILTRL